MESNSCPAAGVLAVVDFRAILLQAKLYNNGMPASRLRYPTPHAMPNPGAPDLAVRAVPVSHGSLPALSPAQFGNNTIEPISSKHFAA